MPWAVRQVRFPRPAAAARGSCGAKAAGAGGGGEPDRPVLSRPVPWWAEPAGPRSRPRERGGDGSSPQVPGAAPKCPGQPPPPPGQAHRSWCRAGATSVGPWRSPGPGCCVFGTRGGKSSAEHQSQYPRGSEADPRRDSRAQCRAESSPGPHGAPPSRGRRSGAPGPPGAGALPAVLAGPFPAHGLSSNTVRRAPAPVHSGATPLRLGFG